MTTKRQENYIFSIQSMTVYEYGTGKPYCTRQYNGGNGTLNASINVALLEGADVNSTKRVEAFGGAFGIDASMKEAPFEIINIANAGALTTEAACASAFVANIANVSGTTLSGAITGIAVSAGQHSTVVYDTIYAEVLSSTTFKIVNYSKGLSSDTLSVGGFSAAADILASAVAPQIVAQTSAALTPGHTLKFETFPIHGGRKISSIGQERTSTTTKYVGAKGVAVDLADGNTYSFELYKCLLTGAPQPFVHGEHMTLDIHMDSQIDDDLSTPAAGKIELLKGA